MKWIVQENHSLSFRDHDFSQNGSTELMHYGVKGMRWGVRHDRELIGKRVHIKKKGVAPSDDLPKDEGPIFSHNEYSSNKNQITVTNLGIKGCTQANFDSRELYDRWRSGQLTPKELSTLSSGRHESMSSLSTGTGESKGDISNVSYTASMAEVDYFHNAIEFEFDNEEDRDAFLQSIMNQYMEMMTAWAKEQGYLTESKDNKQEMKQTYDSMDDKEKGFLEDMVKAALASSGSNMSPKEFIENYFK